MLVLRSRRGFFCEGIPDIEWFVEIIGYREFSLAQADRPGSAGKTAGEENGKRVVGLLDQDGFSRLEACADSRRDGDFSDVNGEHGA